MHSPHPLVVINATRRCDAARGLPCLPPQGAHAWGPDPTRRKVGMHRPPAARRGSWAGALMQAKAKIPAGARAARGRARNAPLEARAAPQRPATVFNMMGAG